jgi:hypothetical protein
MAKIHAFQRARAARGIKTAVLALVLASGAVAADHVFFGKPQSQALAAAVAAPVPVLTVGYMDGFALPDHLRHPTAADAPESAPTF